ncbi:MAG: ubiquinol-cytochrome C chaperone family protein [Pseudolabrys sp.]
MILPLFRRSSRPGTISALYGMIVAQARLPSFYLDYGVPDTVNGRFDLIVLHLAVVLQRLTREDHGFRAFGQRLFDRFCLDMDHNLREMGIGDLSVPREMGRVGKAYYGRSQTYMAALAAADDEQLIQALGRNVFGAGGAEPAGARRLAAYVREAVGGLMRQDTVALIGGALKFPDPMAITASKP